MHKQNYGQTDMTVKIVIYASSFWIGQNILSVDKMFCPIQKDGALDRFDEFWFGRMYINTHVPKDRHAWGNPEIVM